MRITLCNCCLILTLLGGAASLARADSLELRDGRRLHGKYVGGTAGVIAFSADGAIEYFSVKQVLALLFTLDDTPEGAFHKNAIPKEFNNRGSIPEATPVPATLVRANRGAASRHHFAPPTRQE
jgi:hypothetical protein